MVCSLKEPGLAIVDCSDLAKGRKHLQSRCKVQQYTKRVYERGSWVYSVFFFSIQATLIYQYDYAFIHIHTCSATWHMHLCLCMSAVSFTCMSSCVCACTRVRMPAVTCMMFCMQLGHPHTSHTSSVYSYTTYTQTYKLSYLLEYMLMYTQTCTSRSVSAHTHTSSADICRNAQAHIQDGVQVLAPLFLRGSRKRQRCCMHVADRIQQYKTRGIVMCVVS